MSKVGEHFREQFELSKDDWDDITREDMEGVSGKDKVRVWRLSETDKGKQLEDRLNWLLEILKHLGSDGKVIQQFLLKNINNIKDMDDETWDRYIKNIQMLDNGNVLVIDDK